MFPLEGNGIRPYREELFESWHQALPQPPRPVQNPDRYKWDDINALFEDQVQMVTINHPNPIDSKAHKSKSKGMKSRLLGSIKVKRLGKPKTGGKLRCRSVVDLQSCSKGRKLSLKLDKRGISATRLLQSIKKKLKKAIRTAAEAHK